MIPWLKQGNTAVITGGANGIGLAAAKRFLDAGMNVAIADINQEALDAAKASFSDSKLIAETCDVCDADQVAQLKQSVSERFGEVHCLMNNAGAGVTRAKPWEDLAGWKKQIDINLWGIIHGCHVFIPTRSYCSGLLWLAHWGKCTALHL